MATLNQDTINALVVDLQQAAAAAAPPAQRNTAPSPDPIVEKFVEYPFKTGINFSTFDENKLYWDAKK